MRPRQANHSRAIRNATTGLYDVVLGSVTYSMRMETLRLLNTYLPRNGYNDVTVEDWYRDLPKEEKENIVLSETPPSPETLELRLRQYKKPTVKFEPPVKPPAPDEFYPDVSYED